MRVENDETWSLFCPAETEPMLECSNEDFNQLLLAHEILNIGTTYSAQEIWHTLLETVAQGTGPILMFKDSVNRESISTTHMNNR